MVNPNKSALVLGGGGITGFLYEVAVLAAFEEASAGAFGAGDFDIYLGTSAGAVLAALLANGASVGEIYGALDADDGESLFNFRQGDVFGLGARGPLSLILQFLRPVPGIIRRSIRGRHWPSLAGALADFQAHHPPGFYSTDPLQHTLCSRFTALEFRHHFNELGRELYVTGTDIDSGERLVFGSGDLRDFHICRAVSASCAIPIFFRPIRIGERDVVDGGVSGAPLDVCVERGAQEILFVNPLVPLENDRSRVCLPLDEGHCARIAEKGVGWIGDQAMRILFSVEVSAARKALAVRHPEVRVSVVSPARDEVPMFMANVMSFSARKEILAYGRESASRYFSGSGRPLLERLRAEAAVRRAL